MALLDNIGNAPLRSEFLRAVNLVTTTQLSMFIDREPPSRDSMIERLNQKLSLNGIAGDDSAAMPSVDVSPTDISREPLTGSANATANSNSGSRSTTATAAGSVANSVSNTATTPAGAAAIVAAEADSLIEKQAAAMREVLLESLEIYNDPFATYINPQQLKNYNNKRKGNLLGVGIKFRAYDEDYPVILGALLGGPLEGRVQPGDRMITIDGVDQQGAKSSQVGRALKGKEGSSVNVLLRSKKGEERAITATRSQIKLLYARAEMLENQVGYIKISRFGGNTHVTVRGLLQDLLQQGAQSLVLDLRDNPGGSTRAARGIVSLFVDKQNVYCERYEAGGMRELPHEGEKLTDLPLSVVVNEHSMSSSEIVAGALQDYGRATLVGAPTYGKGLIQKVFNLKAPLGGAVRTTIAAYATPSHTLIHGVGVTPDIFEATAEESMFRETGSLNVSADTRAYKRRLLEQRIVEENEQKRADYLIALKDEQLLRAIKEIT